MQKSAVQSSVPYPMAAKKAVNSSRSAFSVKDKVQFRSKYCRKEHQTDHQCNQTPCKRDHRCKSGPFYRSKISAKNHIESRNQERQDKDTEHPYGILNQRCFTFFQKQSYNAACSHITYDNCSYGTHKSRRDSIFQKLFIFTRFIFPIIVADQWL